MNLHDDGNTMNNPFQQQQDPGSFAHRCQEAALDGFEGFLRLQLGFMQAQSQALESMLKSVEAEKTRVQNAATAREARSKIEVA